MPIPVCELGPDGRVDVVKHARLSIRRALGAALALTSPMESTKRVPPSETRLGESRVGYTVWRTVLCCKTHCKDHRQLKSAARQIPVIRIGIRFIARLLEPIQLVSRGWRLWLTNSGR